MKTTVTLSKGAKGTRTWEHSNRRDAIRRAEALACLHSVNVEYRDDNLYVDASRFYDKGLT